jgi:hypothetical protein
VNKASKKHTGSAQARVEEVGQALLFRCEQASSGLDLLRGRRRAARYWAGDAYEEHMLLPDDRVALLTDRALLLLLAPGFAAVHVAAENGGGPTSEADIPKSEVKWEVPWTVRASYFVLGLLSITFLVHVTVRAFLRADMMSCRVIAPCCCCWQRDLPPCPSLRKTAEGPRRRRISRRARSSGRSPGRFTLCYNVSRLFSFLIPIMLRCALSCKVL